jgi:hypothetical protein
MCSASSVCTSLSARCFNCLHACIKTSALFYCLVPYLTSILYSVCCLNCLHFYIFLRAQPSARLYSVCFFTCPPPLYSVCCLSCLHSFIQSASSIVCFPVLCLLFLHSYVLLPPHTVYTLVFRLPSASAVCALVLNLLPHLSAFLYSVCLLFLHSCVLLLPHIVYTLVFCL